MQIILVSDRLATAKTITLSIWHALGALILLVVLMLGLSSAFSLLTLKHASELRLPWLSEVVARLQQPVQAAVPADEFVRENLAAMALRLGQMQAQLIQLDSLGARLANMTGIKPQDGVRPLPPGQGGPLLSPSPLSARELSRQIERVSNLLDQQGDYMGVLEDELLHSKAKLDLMPSALPVDAVPWNASGFGWRIDPFSGQKAMHEGVDFVAEAGTRIQAAAAGVVLEAGFHPQYGNWIEIDHGNDIVTRYAHASRLFVKPGMVVKRGQKIAEIGNTGRSTGAHLHFEVRIRGQAQNPNRFLEQARKVPANALALAR